MSTEQIFQSLLQQLEALRGFKGSYDTGVADAMKVVELHMAAYVLDADSVLNP